MTTMQELKAKADNSDLIRKVQNISIWLAAEDAPEVEKLVGADGQLIPLPEEYQPLGMITKDDGVTFSSEFDSEGVEAHGYLSEVREDPTSQERTFQVNALESNRITLQEAHGIDLSTVSLDADGNLVFDEPEIPIRQFGRIVAIGSDGAGVGEYFMGRWYPRVKVNSIDDLVWSMTDPLSYNLTYKAFPDPQLGISVRHLWAGAGFKASAERAGFKLAASSPGE
ncbi:hypothetical protein [Brevibacterium gallinarum]|uniref:Uncharacterized protein n=1 Tax=Brevibacterium gallinarum TaxID=2762220 RepID=A0ABR8WQN6_9MICO|nr:hypothetical protein [Brevibacterium gallinarum]MBD8019390.1 hypothetical protein [Brevibacterium gallinarum]